MRSRRVAAYVLATSLVGPLGARAQSPEAIRDMVMDNGLHVIVMPNHATPVATVEISVRAGSFTQVEPADEGIPHILEHMLFKTYDDGRGFGPDAAGAGASYNGTTGDERATYFVTLPSDRVERGIEILANLVRDPDFDADALDEERLVVQGELQRMASDPYTILDLVSDQALWGRQFLRKNAIGNIGTIMSADIDRVREHYRRFYVPNNAALIVSGDVDVDDVFRWARDRFRRWRQRPDPFAGFPYPQIEPLQRDTAFVLDMASTDVTFRIKWHGPSVSEDPTGSYAADVFSALFNQATSGAQRRLVDSGLFQGLSLGYQTQDHTGPIGLTARTTPEAVARAVVELGVELSLFGDPSYVSEEALEAAKRSLRVDAAIRRENVSSAAHDMATFWAIAGIDYYETYADRLQEVTLEDVRAYLDRYLIGQPKVVAVLTADDVARRLRPLIGRIVAGWPR